MLQAKALQAQMNPHFIFNCLNSIQSYIMSNDRLAAMDYLSLFAKLIRQYLKASSQKEITLEDEINLLSSYLTIEQLRKNNNFEYNIKVESILDYSKIMIPPLLIQPFVENAIIHGLLNKPRNGRIDINFRLSEQKLLVEIRDNGSGIQNNFETKDESLGLKITSKRLEFINNQTTNFTISNRLGESGAEVKLEIMYQLID